MRAPLVAELQEGQTLYVPPFWLHHVLAVDAFSASVSVWSTSAEALRKAPFASPPFPTQPFIPAATRQPAHRPPPSLRPPPSPHKASSGTLTRLAEWVQAALERLPLPFESDWPRPTTLLAAALFVQQLLVAVYLSPQAARAALALHLSSRFTPLATLPESHQGGLLTPDPELRAELRVCTDRSNPSLEAERRRLEQRVRGHVPRVADAVAQLSADPAVRSIALANYVEAIAHFVAGAQNTHEFLRTCCAAGVGAAETESTW